MFSASLRAASLNSRLANLAASVIEQRVGQVDLAARAEFDVPSVGGNRGLWTLRIPLEHLGARVFPDMFSLAQAHTAFKSEGGIGNQQLGERFEMTIKAFMDLVEAAKKYPCAKKSWFEFLGEQTSPITARAQ